MTETNETQVKAVGNYKLKFKTAFNREQEDYIILNLKVSEDMQALLKQAKSETDTSLLDIPMNNGVIVERYQRYRVKNWVFNGLYSEKGGFLFLKELIDAGEANLRFAKLSTLQTFLQEMKDNFRNLIEVVLRASRVDLNVTYNVAGQ